MEAKKKEREKKEIDFKHNFKVYWSVLRKYRWYIVVLLVIIMLIETSHAVDRFLFKIIIDRGTEFSSGKLGHDAFVHILLLLLAIFLSILFLKLLLRWIHLHLINRLEANSIYDLKKKFFNHVLHLSYNFHTTHRTGSLISRLVRGGKAMEAITDVFIFNTFPLLFQLIVVSVSLIYFDWVPAVVVIATVIVFISYSIFIQQKQRGPSVMENDAEDAEKAQVGDFLTNIDSIKYFGKEEDIKRRYSFSSSKTMKAMLKHWDYFRWLDSGHSLILGTGLFFLIYFPLKQFLAGTMTLGTLVFIYTIYGNIFFPLFNFVHGLKNFYRAMADFEALFQYGKIHNEIKDKPAAKQLKIKDGTIVFKNIDFGYHQKKLFHNFSLTVPKDKKVALVGHSGCGKTTLIRLLYRLYDVQSGEIIIDGNKIREVRQESLRSELSMVPQECILFDDTIYNNIAFSKPGVSRRDVFQAMTFAQLDQVVNNFPNKENTIVGERGVKLSGGEKQRVSIARAILADKKVLILDEATSSLDSETEHEIQKDLQKLMQGRTSIIIAHRLSTIMKADWIVVMKSGQIVQMGKHRDLIRQPGEYQKLWNLQKGGFIK